MKRSKNIKAQKKIWHFYQKEFLIRTYVIHLNVINLKTIYIMIMHMDFKWMQKFD